MKAKYGMPKASLFRIGSKTICLLMALSMPLIAFDDLGWRFGGSTYGVKVWFSVKNECKNSGVSQVRIKLENSKPYPVDFHYRIKNSYWNKMEEKLIPPNSVDSTYQYSTDEKTCRVRIDRLWGEAKLEEKLEEK